MTRVSLERIADTLFPQPEKGNSTAYGSVESVNADGSYQVKLNASSTTTRAARLCDASAGDRVLVLIQANGHCAAIGRVGGNGGPVALYDDATGTTGAVTLSSSAANFEHMRIYARKSNGQNQCVSVDVYNPNGKYANITVFEPSSENSGAWWASRTVYINGTSITTDNNANGFIGGSPYGGSSNEVAIYRVEAW